MKKYKWGALQKQEDYLPLYDVSNIVHDPPKTKEVKSPLYTSSVKHLAIARVNPQHLKCIHMIEKHAFSRGVIHSLTRNVC